jgi:hypothetical protein
MVDQPPLLAAFRLSRVVYDRGFALGGLLILNI